MYRYIATNTFSSSVRGQTRVPVRYPGINTHKVNHGVLDIYIAEQVGGYRIFFHVLTVEKTNGDL